MYKPEGRISRLKVNVSIASEEDILVSNANQPQNVIFVDTDTI
jgi:hypothetical protein